MADSQTLPTNDLSQRFALDTQGFDALRAQAAASPSAGLKQVSKQFDAMFIEMMLKSMRDATPSEGVLDSNDSKQYTAMLDQQLAQQLSSRGIGVAEALTRQLAVNGNLPAGSAGAGTGAGAAGNSALQAFGGGAGGMPGADGTDANAGSMEAMNALAKAYANAAHGHQNASLGESQPWSGNDSLKPSLKGSGSAQASAFVDALASPAQAASQVTGIPARYILGQAALESGWGRREVRGGDGSRSYNVFNIKAGHGWTGRTVTAMTTEFVDGVAHRVQAQFRAYSSYAEAMTDYANFLKSNPRYASVLGDAHDDTGFAQGMQQAGYATDPNYAHKLLSVIRQLI